MKNPNRKYACIEYLVEISISGMIIRAWIDAGDTYSIEGFNEAKEKIIIALEKCDGMDLSAIETAEKISEVEGVNAIQVSIRARREILIGMVLYNNW